MTALPMTMPIGAAGDEAVDEAADEAADDELVAGLRAGDRNAVEQAYVASRAASRAFAHRLVGDEAAAEDIVHEAFVAMRRRRATERRAARDEVRPPPAAPAPADDRRRKRLADRLWSALDRLPIDQRVVFVLCEAEQQTSVEVGAIVGAPEGTVRTRLFHAKRKLREILEDEREGGSAVARHGGAA